MYTELAAVGCLVWYVFIVIVSTIGTVQIFRHYSRPPLPPVSSHSKKDVVPHVTIIRPCTGLEVYLYECLAATFHQDYPTDKLTVSFCVSSRKDAAYPVLVKLLQDYTDYDAKIYVEEEDENLQSENGTDIGPNPKIRNMSQAYRKAKGDIVWILDCNIWVGQGACGRMVDKLCGFTPQGRRQDRPYKLVAHLPVCISVDNLTFSSSSTKKASASGGLLEQSFLSTAHAKMYVAINSVAVAPCINGKSTMFRRSHLDHLTKGYGIDYFGQNICEDHLIGDLLWKSYIPPRLEFSSQPDPQPRDQRGEETTYQTNPGGLRYKNHGLAMNDLAIQPISNMSVSAYIARRVRWLRVRKFTVPVATLVEPGTESLLCSAFGAWGATTSPYTRHIFGATWLSFLILWLASITLWCMVDYLVFSILQGGGSIEDPSSSAIASPVPNSSYGTLSHESDPATQPQSQNSIDQPSNPPPSSLLPPFAAPYSSHNTHQPQHLSPLTWLSAWLSRESLALPIWTWAIYGGTTVVWRDKKFWVGTDMKVHEIK